MENFALLIKKFREDRGLSQKELAEKAGVGNGTIGDIERGERKGKLKTLDKISIALKLTQDERNRLDNAFMGKDLKQKPNVIIINEELIQIPIIAKASAGNGYLNFEESTKTISIRKNGFDENCYLIEVEGDSMEPLIRDGAYIVVDPRETEIIDNKIYVVEFEEQAYIKKVIKNEQLKVIILKSINPEYDDIYIQEEKIEDFKVKGRAIKFILEGKL